MKKLILLLLIPVLSFAQDEPATEKSTFDEEGTTIGLYLLASDPGQFGVSYEQFYTDDKGFVNSALANVGYSALTLDYGMFEVTGEGTVIELGSRRFFKKNRFYGFYSESFISYGTIKFDKEPVALGVFSGRYSYISLINPNLGYKIRLGKKFSFEPSVGFNWKWEIKGKGDVDNKNIDNFVPRIGVKIAYKI